MELSAVTVTHAARRIAGRVAHLTADALEPVNAPISDELRHVYTVVLRHSAALGELAGAVEDLGEALNDAIAASSPDTDELVLTRESAGRLSRLVDLVRVREEAAYPQGQLEELGATVRGLRRPELVDLIALFMATRDECAQMKAGIERIDAAAEDYLDGLAIDEANAEQGDDPPQPWDEVKRELGL